MPISPFVESGFGEYVVKKNELIAVYGTLRRGERMDLSKEEFKYGVAFQGADRINGRLYHLGGYPGLKLLPEPHCWDATDPAVTIEVFRILDLSIVAIMDAYEGYIPEKPYKGLYDRCRVETERGRTVWVYCYNHPVTEDQRIDSGDWCRNREAPVRSRRLA